MKKDKAEEILQAAIKNNTQHRDYEHVVKYMKLMRQLITGDGIHELLHQFVTRETDAEFTQRKVLSHIVTSSVCASIMSPANKIPRVKATVDTIDFETDDKGNTDAQKISVDEKIVKLKKAIADYNGGAGVDGYNERRLIPLMYLDPNGFIVTTFDDFDARFKKPKPYPVYVSCEDAILYDISDNDLNWLIVRKGCRYAETVQAEGDKPSQVVYMDGKLYQIYTDEDIVEYVQVSSTKYPIKVGETITNGEGTFIKIDETRVFKINYYTPKTGGLIQAKRIGCILDETTDARTCVSPLNPAIPYLLNSIKLCSELNISVTLHIFLQKIAYQPPCQGESLTKSCTRGFAPDGEKCKVCGGTGWAVHKSSQDVIYLPLPRDANDAFDLAKLIHYQDLPIEIVKFLDEYLKDTIRNAFKSVYNSEAIVNSLIEKTATEKDYDMQGVYDALYPVARQFSAHRTHQIRLIAALMDLSGAIITHQFPKDFKFRSWEALLGYLKLANDSGAPVSVRQDISNDIMLVMFQDRPDELKKIQVKQVFNPFDGKSMDEIIFVITNNLTTMRNKILWSEAATIFSELEQESEVEGKWFYDLSFKEQKTKVEAKITAIIEQIATDTPQPTAFNASGIPADASTEEVPAATA